MFPLQCHKTDLEPHVSPHIVPATGAILWDCAYCKYQWVFYERVAMVRHLLRKHSVECAPSAPALAKDEEEIWRYADQVLFDVEGRVIEGEEGEGKKGKIGWVCRECRRQCSGVSTAPVWVHLKNKHGVKKPQASGTKEVEKNEQDNKKKTEEAKATAGEAGKNKAEDKEALTTPPQPPQNPPQSSLPQPDFDQTVLSLLTTSIQSTSSSTSNRPRSPTLLEFLDSAMTGTDSKSRGIRERLSTLLGFRPKTTDVTTTEKKEEDDNKQKDGLRKQKEELEKRKEGLKKKEEDLKKQEEDLKKQEEDLDDQIAKYTRGV